MTGLRERSGFCPLLTAFCLLPSDFGGAEGDRTPDLMNAIHALSQLSYGPFWEGYVSKQLIETNLVKKIKSSYCSL